MGVVTEGVVVFAFLRGRPLCLPVEAVCFGLVDFVVGVDSVVGVVDTDPFSFVSSVSISSLLLELVSSLELISLVDFFLGDVLA